MQREQNERAWLAWHTAVLPRAKKFPPLSKLLMKNKTRVRQTPDQMLAVVRQWNALLGGATTGKPN